MTNNYMFRYILQKNENVLKGLICSLLHLKSEDVQSIEINRLIGLEMQVLNEYNWPERSLSYLCRTYDQLYRGQEYEDALPTIHIGFLDFTLHPSHPEFYATYQMLNVKIICCIVTNSHSLW